MKNVRNDSGIITEKRKPGRVGLTLLAAQLCRVHRLAQDLDRHVACLIETAILLVILLQQALCACIVGTSAGRLPSTVVSGRVAEVELELPSGIPTSVDEGDTEGSQTTVLCVSLLQVAESADELLARNVFVICEEIALGGLAGVVDEDVGVGCHSCYGANHVAVQGQWDMVYQVG